MAGKKKKKKRRIIRRIFIAVGITAFVLHIPIFLANNRSFQQWFVKTYRPFAPWRMHVSKLRIEPWKFKVHISGLRMSHSGGHEISVDSITARVKPLRLFFRGQLALEPLEIRSPTVTIAKTPKLGKKQGKKHFKLRTALLLRNLILDKSYFEDVQLNLPNNKSFHMEKFFVTLEPFLLGGQRLALEFNKTLYKDRKGNKHRFKTLLLRFSTNLDAWSKSFPYVDDAEGELFLKSALIGGAYIKELKAGLLYKNGNISLNDFSAVTGHGLLVGSVKTNIDSKQFSVDLDTPDSIPLPSFVRGKTFTFEGNLKTKIHLEGSGYDLRTSQGKGSLEATHLFAGDTFPAQLKTGFHWSGGKLQLEDALLKTDKSEVRVAGHLDLKPFALHLKLEATDFPIEYVFEKFVDKNLHPIHGLGTFTGEVDGIGQSIHFQLKGSAREGGYNFVNVGKVDCNLDITYQKLTLNGTIFSAGKETGKSLFEIFYGPRIGDERSKKIELDLAFNGQPLEALLPGYHLSGEADAHLHLTGPSKNVSGRGTLTAQNGGIFGQGYESIDLGFLLTTKQLLIDTAHLTVADTDTAFTQPLTIDFIPGGLRLHGRPVKTLDLDLNYRSNDKLWTFKKIDIYDKMDPSLLAEIRGQMRPTSMQIKIKGEADISLMKYVTQHFREASGPASFDLVLSGSPLDIAANGTLTFKNSFVSFRNYPVAADELKGTLRFHGGKIETEDLSGLFGTGTFHLKGSLIHAAGLPKSYDLFFRGSELYYRNQPGNFRMEYDADLKLKGPAVKPVLSGSLTILDGRYSKDFNIIEEIKEAPRAAKEVQAAAQEGTPILLNLDIRNLGDLIIDNNVGRIELSTAMHLSGSDFNPQVEGSVDVTEGEIRYLGLDLDITRGFMEFRGRAITPYLEIHAEKDLADVHITARLHGHTDNLNMDLGGSSTRGGPLEKKDVLSLALFGMTTSERSELAAFQQFQLGPEIVAEQIARLLQRPLAKATKLDVVRLEATPTREGRIQRFHVGKRINDRLTVEFASELAKEDAIQTFLLEYWLTDIFLLKGARSSEDNFELNIGVRLTSR